MAVKVIVLQWRKPGGHWVEYDRTRVENWADVQEKRMKIENPGCEYRRVMEW